ncbi:hypothetical protein NPIL_458671 [Nephila pilipes]|uniref:Uncharacterized protein n=1 Tax=Nephila pilipes TaxID=299642 RepID=A0A8X6NY63_NEPPI|nr:hypothetical protein NPIL_458671 [Nephila pilipes]
MTHTNKCAKNISGTIKCAENISVSHNNIKVQNKAFLQTYTILACSYTKSILLTNLILDYGSHRSFVFFELVKKLKLRSVRYEWLAIFALREKTVRKRKYPIVSITLRNREECSQCYVTEALVTEFISNVSLNISDVSIRDAIGKKGLHIDDSYLGNSRIDVIIG